MCAGSLNATDYTNIMIMSSPSIRYIDRFGTRSHVDRSDRYVATTGKKNKWKKCENQIKSALTIIIRF